MTTTPEAMLTVADIAKRTGLAEVTIRAYAHRGQMPAPSGRLGRTPWWWESKLTTWLANYAPEPTGPVSSAASAKYPNTCRTCGAKPWHPCKSPKSGRTTDVHAARRDDELANNGVTS
jgi:predicted DNA-binding transcriptional regulator AlpA